MAHVRINPAYHTALPEFTVDCPGDRCFGLGSTTHVVSLHVDGQERRVLRLCDLCARDVESAIASAVNLRSW